MECRENFITYHGRFYYIKKLLCKIGEKQDKAAYAYLGLDMTMKEQQKSSLCSKITDQHLSDGTIYERMDNYGLFMLVLMRPLEASKVLTLYYTRNQIEEVFGVDEGGGKRLLLRITPEETFPGHLLVTFLFQPSLYF